MPLVTESYLEQVARWPASGRHILAQFDAASVLVYQAYQPRIGRFAAAHGSLGGDDFSLQRMSWIKPNFLWMMYRSGWGTRVGQEITLAVRLRRAAFDAILAAAVHSTYTPEVYAHEDVWREAVARSEVRLQWDPDHDPAGAPVMRRAIQLGVRGTMLRHYATDWILEIEDISAFVAEQRSHAHLPFTPLLTPSERRYPVVDPAVAARLGVAPPVGRAGTTGSA